MEDVWRFVDRGLARDSVCRSREFASVRRERMLTSSSAEATK